MLPICSQLELQAAIAAVATHDGQGCRTPAAPFAQNVPLLLSGCTGCPQTTNTCKPSRSSLEAYNREIEELKREMQQSTRTAQAIRWVCAA